MEMVAQFNYSIFNSYLWRKLYYQTPIFTNFTLNVDLTQLRNTWAYKVKSEFI